MSDNPLGDIVSVQMTSKGMVWFLSTRIEEYLERAKRREDTGTLGPEIESAMRDTLRLIDGGDAL